LLKTNKKNKIFFILKHFNIKNFLKKFKNVIIFLDMKKMKNLDPFKIFNSYLFWDTKEVDLKKHSSWLISRVLDFGDAEDIKTLRKIYSDIEIIDVIKKRKGLSRKTAIFWATYYNIPFEEIKCLKK